MPSDSTTPMMRQYHRIKAQHRDAILFFRLGDFYEMFFEDAELASRLLDITLTARHKGTPSEAPMCGVPYHSADSYIAKLLQAGHKVAIAEQMEDAAASKGMVKREVVRVLTPGTLVEDSMLSGKANNFVVAVCRRDEAAGVAALDVSTGEFYTGEFEGDDALQRVREEIDRWEPAELCLPEGVDASDVVGELEGGEKADGAESGEGGDGVVRTRAGATVTALPPWTFDPDRARTRLCEHFGVASLAGYDLEGVDLAVAAAGALLHYAGETRQAPLHHIRSLRRQRERDVLQLDAVSRRSLELVRSWQEGRRAESLLAVLDETVTAMGARRLRQWLLRPLREPGGIVERQDVVEALHEDPVGRDGLRDGLRGVQDLERLTTRVTLGTAGPRDLAALRGSLEALPACREVLGELAASGALLERLLERLDPCDEVVRTIAERLVDDPPASISDGGVIREGYHEELDRLRRARSEGKEFIAELQSRERERTGIGSLKVGFNKVFGYYIEVSNPNLGKVPDDYIRKQTLTNSERFVTPELKEFEETVLSAEEKIGVLEEKLFGELRDQVAASAGRLHRTAGAVASVDALAALAEVAARRGYVRPVVDDGTVIEIHQGRHPVVEHLQADRRFVPNDAYLDDADHRILLVTGPNMGGKSTYLRQVALIVIMAQMGGFVPAESARIGVVDRIFTRVGASDNLVRGASTFLVEMQETATILNSATPRSLVILDEVGRGTSTYDGLAIAWAVVEHLHHSPEVAARTLFATHYHELTRLEGELDGLVNLSVSVHEGSDGVVFLHRVVPGPADRSYGIQVGRLAGLPRSVVERAEQILASLEGGGRQPRPPAVGEPAPGAEPPQMQLFEQRPHPIVEELRRLDTDRLTPLEALQTLASWRERLSGDAGDDE